MGRAVTQQFRTTKVTVPLGTAQAAPTTTLWDLGPVVLETLEVMVPRGHSGLTGVHIDYGGVAIIPFGQPPVFLVADNERLTIPVGIEVGAPLQVVAYNTDVFDHSFYLRAMVDVLLGQDVARPGTTLLDLSAGGRP